MISKQARARALEEARRRFLARQKEEQQESLEGRAKRLWGEVGVSAERWKQFMAQREAEWMQRETELATNAQVAAAKGSRAIAGFMMMYSTSNARLADVLAYTVDAGGSSVTQISSVSSRTVIPEVPKQEPLVVPTHRALDLDDE